MKNIKLSLITLMALGTFSYAGGDFNVVTPYEVDDVLLAEEAYVEPEEAYVEPEVVPEPEPVVVHTPAPAPVVVAPTPKPEPVVVTPKPVSTKHITPNGFYAGLGLAVAKYVPNCKCPGAGTRDKTAGVMARAGYDFNKYIGIEARGIKTNWKTEGGKVEHAGLYVKPMLPFSNSANVYGLVGFGKTKTIGRYQKVNADGLALGLGVEVDVSKDTPKDGRYGRTFDGHGDQEKGLGVFADYERMLVKSGAPKLDAVSAGVTYDF